MPDARSTVRVALAQANSVVGDLSGNASLLMQVARQASAAGADILVSPEMALVGYPVEDLALRPSFQDASVTAIHALARHLDNEGLGGLIAVIGYLDHLDEVDLAIAGRPRRAPVNAAAVIYRGAVIGRYVKHHLPNYGVFDENRYFVPGSEPLSLNLDGATIDIAICEDLWRTGGPVSWAREHDACALLVLNASPYERNKDDVRLDLCRDRARESGAAIVYANLVGGQDELVFDGDSMVVDAEGTLLARAPQFESTLLLADIALRPGPEPASCIRIERAAAVHEPLDMSPAPRLDDHAEVYGALVCGLRDYVGKNGFTGVLLGMSGGIDSALVAALAVDALGPERVHGVAMPSVHSSDHSVADAYDLAARTGASIRTVAIAPMVDAYESSMELSGLAAENLQARVRGTTLMAISNQEGHLVLATGNKSEISVGYSTIYGDAVGGFAPIKDVPKTLVWELSRWRNALAESRGETLPIPPSSIEKPPSAELRPGQLDTDSLPDYAQLDAMLELYVAGDHSAASLVAAGFPADEVERILRLTDLAEYKRRQYPPGTKITPRAFGRDRRQPITNRWRERA